MLVYRSVNRDVYTLSVAALHIEIANAGILHYNRDELRHVPHAPRAIFNAAEGLKES